MQKIILKKIILLAILALSLHPSTSSAALGVTTGGFSNLFSTSVTLAGSLIQLPGKTAFASFRYKKGDFSYNPNCGFWNGFCITSTSIQTIVSDLSGYSTFSADLTGLEPNTKYSYFATASMIALTFPPQYTTFSGSFGTFTTPAAGSGGGSGVGVGNGTCPAGWTGTYPNCVDLHGGNWTYIGGSGGSFVPNDITNVKTYPAPMPMGDITDDSAIFNGKADTNGKSVYGYFRYSRVEIPPVFCNQIYGSDMIGANETKITGTGVTFSSTIIGLEPNTRYAYCAIVSNTAKGVTPTEIKYGGVVTFTTKPCKTCDQSSVETKDARVMGKASAYLNGFYNSAVPIKVWFEYREKGREDWIVRNEKNKCAGRRSTDCSGDVNFLLTGLTTQTTYQFRLAGLATIGTTHAGVPQTYYGQTLEFTTLGKGGLNLHLTVGDEGSGSTCGNTGWAYGDPACANTNTCRDVNAVNFGGVLPCSYSSNVCFDPRGNEIACSGSNGGGNEIFCFTSSGNEIACPNPIPNGVICRDKTGNEIACPVNYNNNTNNGTAFQGSGTIGGGIFGGNNGTVLAPAVLGAFAIPFADAVVHYHEGVETVFTRQIMNSPGLAHLYGYVEGTDLKTFAENLSHVFAQVFGYYSGGGREIRVSYPDIAAYELGLKDGMLAVYEYYDNHLTGIQTAGSALKTKFGYEYYFQGR